MPQKQWVWDGLTFVLATDVDPVTLTAAVRAELKAVDPDLPLSNVRTMDEVAAGSVAARRSTMLLLGIFGALALVLAAAGIYARDGATGDLAIAGDRRPDDARGQARDGDGAGAEGGLAPGGRRARDRAGRAVLVMRGFRTVLFHVSPPTR